MNDDFIKVTDIHIENIKNKENDINNNSNIKKVYQLQGIQDSHFCYIMEVGIINKISDILINRFNPYNKIDNEIECLLVSCLHSYDTLNEFKIIGQFPLIKLIVNYKNKDNLIPIAYLFINFIYKNNNNESIIDLISTKDNKIKIDGYYSISLYYRDINKNKNENIDNYMILKSYEQFLGNEKMIEELLFFLLDPNVYEIIMLLKKELKDHMDKIYYL